ncbi:hypothetical protein GQ651_09515 [Alphaproteobacteria bacterium GH1-50]|uniref:DUF4177 domain-containing protein n=1 Tax=Kangsaoukella pontilimi TaxID=2691042 RepID=A0A7C9MW26_9RHOB|nr:hypothetical protein [Kangsaoukella pontilimi]MXQ08080.1 hypothetical protein [Kangsaoukella pontilimi]
MTRILVSIALLAFGASAAQAACYADYKAKQDNPLRLHYGVIEIDASPCEPSPAVENTITRRLAAGGWTLLQVESVFDESALDAKRSDAGEYFLRF